MPRSVVAYLDEDRSLKLAEWKASGECAHTMSDEELVEAARVGLVVVGALCSDQVRQAHLAVVEAE